MPFETPALRLLAQAAAGSMRDALSLTDQAIAYSAGDLTAEAVRGMLGTIDHRHLVDLLQALAGGDAAQVLRVADDLASRGLSYSGALADLAVLLSRIAIQQRIPGTIPADDPQAEDIVQLAARLHPDQAQLFYSVAVHSRQELSLAPDEYAGFVMACLRMLALVPSGTLAPPSPPPSPSGAKVESSSDAPSSAAPEVQVAAAVGEPAAIAPQAAPALPPAIPAAAPISPPVPLQAANDAAEVTITPEDIPAWEELPAAPVAEVDAPMAESITQPDTKPNSYAPPLSAAVEEETVFEAPEPEEFETLHSPDVDSADDEQFEPVEMGDPELEIQDAAIQASAELAAPAFTAERKKAKSPRLRNMTAQAWPALAASLPVTGLAAELARQSEWLDVKGDQVNLRVAIRTLAESPGRARLCTVLSEHFGTVVQLNVEYGATGDETAHAVEQAQKVLRQQSAEQAVAVDPFVQTLISEFGARVVPGSISAVPLTRAA